MEIKFGNSKRWRLTTRRVAMNLEAMLGPVIKMRDLMDWTGDRLSDEAERIANAAVTGPIRDPNGRTGTGDGPTRDDDGCPD